MKDVQKNIKNEPDDYMLNFWKPKTKLKQGIKNIIEMKLKERGENDTKFNRTGI